MEYVDLYLIHWPISLKPGPAVFPVKREDAVPFDFEGVWRAMEECHRLGLAKAIGVSNFTTGHLDKLLPAATVPPAVNQVAEHNTTRLPSSIGLNILANRSTIRQWNSALAACGL